MRLLGRRPRPPADAVAKLDRDERVVSWASTPEGVAVVATPLGVWLPGPAGAERIAWHLVDKAIWRDGTLTLVAATDAGDGVLIEQPPRSVRLSVPHDLPRTVRARVERSIAFTRYHRLPSGGGVRVVGRRVPGSDGLTWQLVFDTGVDSSDPDVRAVATGLVEHARAEVGL